VEECWRHRHCASGSLVAISSAGSRLADDISKRSCGLGLRGQHPTSFEQPALCVTIGVGLESSFVAVVYAVCASIVVSIVVLLRV
jgi:hypothetical protein